MRLQIKPSDRISVLGRTGSGKTTLLKSLIGFWIYITRLWHPYHIIVLDTKKDGDFRGMGKRFTHLKDLPRLWREYRVLIYEPDETELLGGVESEYLNGFFRWLRLTREPFLLVIDELASVAKGNNVSPEYELIMKQGRARLQMVWAGVQNPVFVPHDFLANVEHIFAFDLNMETDRRKMASIVGDQIMIRPQQIDDAAEFGFNYYNVRRDDMTFFPNNPPIRFNIPADFDPKTAIRMNSENGEWKGGVSVVNWRFVFSLLLLAVLMVFTIPLVKILLDWLASKASILRPVAEYANRT